MSRLRVLANGDLVGFLGVAAGRWSFDYDAGWNSDP